MKSMERLFFWLLEGTKGGPTRVFLLSILEKKPMNLNQLAQASDLDYKTVEHHMGLLEKNYLVERTGTGYGSIFFVSEQVLNEKKIAEMIEKVRGENDGRKRKNNGKQKRG